MVSIFRLALSRRCALVLVATLLALTSGATVASGVASAAVCTSSDVSSIQSNFNGTPIGVGHVIWFNAVFNVSGLPSSGGTLNFVNQSITGVPGVSSGSTIHPPNSYITFKPGASPSAVFDTGQNAWIITLPTGGGGNGLLAAIPVAADLGTHGGGVVTWSGTFNSTIPGLSVSWKWAAATYNPGFPTDPAHYNDIGVTAQDGQVGGDHAGTPENEKSLKDGGGARGGGGSNFTGSYSGTASFKPCQPTPPTVYLAYADSYPPRITTANLPNPWKGGQSVIDPTQPVLFIGCGYQGPDTCPTIPGTSTDWYDDGAIRLDNPTTGAPLQFTGTGSNVTIGYCVYTPWNGLTGTAQPGQTLILSQTGGTEPCGPQVYAHTGINVVPINWPPNENLDTTESYAQSANYLNFVQGGPPVCSNDGLIPTASLKINGATTTVTDSGQLLNHGGVDIGGPICGVTFTASTTNGSTVLTHVQTSQGGTTGLVVGTNITGAGFPNGFTLGESITAVNAAADTITVSDPANVTANGLIETELFSEAQPWSTSGVQISKVTRHTTRHTSRHAARRHGRRLHRHALRYHGRWMHRGPLTRG